MNFSELPFLAESIEWVRANLYWIVLALVVHFSTLGAVAYLILLERKVASWAQDRIGPNRVGWYGLLQPIADGLKFITKEDYKPDKVDTVLYTIAPALMVIVVVVSVAVIPWGGIKGQRVTVDVTNALAEGAAPVEAVNARLPRSHRVIGDVEFFVLPATERVALPEFHRRDRTASFDEATRALLAERAVYSPAGNPRPAPLASNQPRRAPLVGPGAVPVDFARDVVYARYTSGFNFIIADLNIGVLFVLSVLSLAVYGVVVGGWASNNKYSFLGGLRACANMISYEIPLGLSVLAVVIMYGTLDLGGIVERQAGYWLYVIPAWNVFTQPLAFVLFLIGIHAEANRAPFDMAEAEQELVGGYHTEYSSMRFALFFLAEYLGMITTSLVCVALFFGGWHLPWVEWLWAGATSPDPQNSAVTNSWVIILIRCGVFFGKAIGVLFFFMWVRWSLPRFRFDQLMQIAWRGLIPISLALVAGTTLGVYFTRGVTYSEMPFGTAMVFLGINVAVLAASMGIYQLVPKGATVNRRIALPESRYRDTPLPGKPVHRPQKAILPADPGIQLGGAQGGFAAG